MVVSIFISNFVNDDLDVFVLDCNLVCNLINVAILLITIINIDFIQYVISITIMCILIP